MFPCQKKVTITRAYSYGWVCVHNHNYVWDTLRYDQAILKRFRGLEWAVVTYKKENQIKKQAKHHPSMRRHFEILRWKRIRPVTRVTLRPRGEKKKLNMPIIWWTPIRCSKICVSMASGSLILNPGFAPQLACWIPGFHGQWKKNGAMQQPYQLWFFAKFCTSRRLRMLALQDDFFNNILGVRFVSYATSPVWYFKLVFLYKS